MGHNKSTNKETAITQDLHHIYGLYSQCLKLNHQRNYQFDVIPKQKSLTTSILSTNVHNQQIMGQLMSSFFTYKQYSWGNNIPRYFLNYFLISFEQEWKFSRQQFYHILLQTILIENKINDINIKNIKIYQEYFYKYYLEKIKKISNNQQNQKNQKKKIEKIQFINDIIINKQTVINHNNNNNDTLELISYVKSKSCCMKFNTVENIEKLIKQQKRQSNQYNRMRLQKSSVVIPETVFIDRMSTENCIQMDNLLIFYSKFSQTVQQLLNNSNLISAPIKHFQILINNKIATKKIYRKQQDNIIKNIINNNNNNKDCNILKNKRLHNNNLLLKEIKCFTQAYAEFLWKYLNLYQVQDTQMGRIITIDTLYSITLKQVWKITKWLAYRGYEWQLNQIHKLLLQKYSNNSLKIKNNSNLIQVIQLLKDEVNPQVYLKKIVIFYRQATSICTNADELLIVYQNILNEIILCQDYMKYHLFTMRNIIDELINIDSFSLNNGGNGQIIYAWTTWSISINLLLEQIPKNNFNTSQCKSKIITEIQLSKYKNYQ